MSRLDDPERVAREYSSMDRYARRRLDVTGWIRGTEPLDTMLAALAEVRPRRVLDAGCGDGALAALVTAPELVCVDVAPAAVDGARARGLDARLADVRELPFPDGAFDAVMCNWMLYHVPDRARAIRELARVLGPGGRLVGCHNRRGHLAEVWRHFGDDDGAGGEQLVDELRAAFAAVEARPTGGEVVWLTRDDLQAYLDAYVELAGPLEAPAGPYPFRAARRNCVLVADRA